jgi:hypothetical protein
MKRNKNVDVITVPNYAKNKIPEPCRASNYALKKGALFKNKV